MSEVNIVALRELNKSDGIRMRSCLLVVKEAWTKREIIITLTKFLPRGGAVGILLCLVMHLLVTFDQKPYVFSYRIPFYTARLESLPDRSI